MGSDEEWVFPWGQTRAPATEQPVIPEQGTTGCSIFIRVSILARRYVEGQAAS